MLEEHVHRLPQRVIENLDHFLVNEGIRRGAGAMVVAFEARQSEGHGSTAAGVAEGRRHFRIAVRRAEPHDDVFGPNNRVEPGLETRSKDRAPAARACRRSPDARIRPRRAGRRWNTARVRRPAGGRRAGNAPTCRGRPRQAVGDSRAKKSSHILLRASSRCSTRAVSSH